MDVHLIVLPLLQATPPQPVIALTHVSVIDVARGADLVLLEGNPLEDITQVRRIRGSDPEWESVRPF